MLVTSRHVKIGTRQIIIIQIVCIERELSGMRLVVLSIPIAWGYSSQTLLCLSQCRKFYPHRLLDLSLVE